MNAYKEHRVCSATFSLPALQEKKKKKKPRVCITQSNPRIDAGIQTNGPPTSRGCFWNCVTPLCPVKCLWLCMLFSVMCVNDF